MKIELLPTRPGTREQMQLFTTFLVDGRVAVDAGNLAYALDDRQKAKVRHVVLTHTHMDHTASLPIFIDEIFNRLSSPLQVYALPESIATLRQCIFNGSMWPNFEKIELLNGKGPALEFVALTPRVPLKLGKLSLTPFPVNHTIPTAGMLIEDNHAAVIYSADTYITDELWEVASATKHLKAIFVDVSFPNEMESLAGVARHLTPQSLHADLQKLKSNAKILCVHIKPPYRKQVIRQLKALRHPKVSVAEIGKPYRW